MSDQHTETVARCEAKFWSNGRRCHHPAKYLAYVYPKDATAVCGIHARGFMRPIPLRLFDGAGNGDV